MRFGLIGSGLMGQEHLRNLLLIPEATVAAIADPTPFSIEWSRRTLGAAGEATRCFDDPVAMLRETALDAVIVASPNDTHRAVLDLVFAHDVHVLCEKPLATTVADARLVAEQAAHRPGVFWVGMEYRWMPPVAAFLGDVAEGRAGRLRRISMQEHRFPFLPKIGDWNRFNRRTGGTMVEKCCHFFDLMRLMARSEPVSVFCSGSADVNHQDERYDGAVPDITDNAFATVDFANGIRAMLDLCMFAEGAEEQEELVAAGDAARLKVTIPSGIVERAPRVPLGTPKRVERRVVGVDPAVLAAGHHHGATFHQLAAFMRACRGEGPVAVTAADGVAAVAMGVAAERSAAEHRVIAMRDVLG